jgi:hypothetical protein
MLPIQFLTFHCSATPEGRDVSPAIIEAWDIAKFRQKSYHWIIPLDGSMHRSLRDDELGAHVGGHNSHNIGVCYVGGCDKQMKGAKDTLNGRLHGKRSLFIIDVEGAEADVLAGAVAQLALAPKLLWMVEIIFSQRGGIGKTPILGTHLKRFGETAMNAGQPMMTVVRFPPK